MANSPSFVNLLASQGVVDLDSPQPPFPNFSTQCSDECTVKQRRKWSPKEDIILIGAWLNTSKDPIGIKFNLEHAWRELRHDVKWSSTYLEKDSGKDKRKIVDSDAQGSVTEPQERPIGVKAAKAAGKRKKLGKEEELGQLKEMMVTKKEISNQSLLASLAAKTEPLSDMEEALKIKLMSEMLYKTHVSTEDKYADV
ncbi:PREDICTED: glutathione S-transferase T2-like [Brassica oleracea var. oleracea]|uniref:glutathione S-transferase T2-like n=1 Tax=Brassica oleracea var. oleracea TaxID=109376 RepID=UPI0006A7396F|nr:PREDICTED: glutathione S-transferase T2-like [Brassica oleracea var. oleracea]